MEGTGAKIKLNLNPNDRGFQKVDALQSIQGEHSSFLCGTHGTLETPGVERAVFVRKGVCMSF